jgi:Rieske 2Fe-2S family protein
MLQETQVSSDHIGELVASRREGFGLPRPFYHDMVLYQHELERIWRQGWVFAGFTCQLPNSGDYLTLSLESDPLLVLRGDDGQIRAFHNICTHRGTVLCEQEQGHIRAIVCPYHQWTFSRRGELISCVGMQEGIDKAELGLRRAHVEVLEGLIFVSLSVEPPPFAPARALMAPFARPQGFERARVAKIVDYLIPANWKLVWENNRECYHCNVNHPEYIKSNFDIYEDGHGSARIQERLATALARAEEMWRTEGVGITHRQGGLPSFPDADNNIWYSANRTVLTEGYSSESLDGDRVAPLMGEYRSANVGVLRMRTMPNFWVHGSCDHAAATRLLPAGLHQTHARVIWLVHEDAHEGVDYSLDRLLPFWQFTSEQDWELCGRAQRGVNSTAYRPGPLSIAREYNLDAFIRWYLHQLRANS